MRELLGFLARPQEERQQEYGEVERFEAPATGLELGPQPWCRICHHGVDDWIWTHLPNGRWHIAARCHGVVCDGLIPATSTPWLIRAEMFCFHEPHLEKSALWFVAWDGSEIQPAKRYLENAIETGGSMQKVGDFGRKHTINILVGLVILWNLWKLALQ